MSDDGVARDLSEKREEYEQAGVREYLVIDVRDDRRDLTHLRWDAGGRDQPIAPDERERYHSVALPGFWLDPSWLGRDPSPDPEDLMLELAPDAYWAWLLA